MGAAQHQLGQLHQAALAEPREVDHAGERVERLRGADVVRGLLAPDVLLAGLEREHEAAAPVQVARLAGDPARHAPDEALGRREEAEARAAVVQPVAERLALAHADVRAELARRAQHAERERVGGHHEQRPGALAGLGQLAQVLDGAQEVRLLHDHRRRVVVHRRGQRLDVGGAVVGERHLHHLHAVAGRVGAQGGARVRMHGPAGHEARAAASRAWPCSPPRPRRWGPRTPTRWPPAGR